jgi:hypothetical protein
LSGLVRPEEEEGKGGRRRWRGGDGGHFKPPRGGGGRPVRWHHAAGKGRERWRERGGCPDQPAGDSGPRPPGGVARPCRAAGRTRDGEGTDQWATVTVSGDYAG